MIPEYIIEDLNILIRRAKDKGILVKILDNIDNFILLQKKNFRDLECSKVEGNDSIHSYMIPTSEDLFKKYGKLVLNSKELSNELPFSHSKISKMLSKAEEKNTLENNLLPKWKYIGERRYWSIDSVVDFLKNMQL